MSDSGKINECCGHTVGHSRDCTAQPPRDMNPRCADCGETIWLHPEMDFGNERLIDCERFVPQPKDDATTDKK